MPEDVASEPAQIKVQSDVFGSQGQLPPRYSFREISHDSFQIHLFFGGIRRRVIDKDRPARPPNVSDSIKFVTNQAWIEWLTIIVPSHSPNNTRLTPKTEPGPANMKGPRRLPTRC